MDRSVPLFRRGPMTILDMLWNMVLLYGIHHRGPLVLMCRLAGGKSDGCVRADREEVPLPRARDAAACT